MLQEKKKFKDIFSFDNLKDTIENNQGFDEENEEIERQRRKIIYIEDKLQETELTLLSHKNTTE